MIGMEKTDELLFALPNNPIPGLTVLGAGREVQDACVISGMRVLRSYAAVYLLSGEGKFRSPGTQGPVTLHENSLFIIFPGIPHRYEPVDGSWTQFWVVFEGEIPDMLERKGLLSSKNFYYPNVRQWDVKSSFEELLLLATRKPYDYQLQQSVILYRLLLSAVTGSLQHREPISAKEQLVEKIRVRLQENVLLRRPMQSILNVEGYSYNYLRVLFRQVTGISPLDYVNRMRVAYACEQLSYSSQAIKEIAYNAGFDDPHYFSRMFRKITGITPGQYRCSILSYADTSVPEAERGI